MPLYQTSAGDRILAADINQYYNILKGVAASGETVTLIYNAAGVLAIVPSSDPAASTQLFQIKNAASAVKSALTAGGGAVFSSVVNFAKSADIASSGTTDLSTATGNYAVITGTTTITAFGTVQAGTMMVLEFSGILTLTHNATSLILRSGANATTAAGDIYIFVSEGSGNWREVAHLTAIAASNITLGTEQATTSGTSITFTGIPSWAKRITVNLVGVSTNGTSIPKMRIGPSGGVETSAYSGSVANAGNTANAQLSTGFDFAGSWGAATTMHGTFTLTLEKASTNTWVCTWVLTQSDAIGSHFGSGSKSLAGTLDRLALTTANGTDAYDAGAANITYE